MSYRRHHPAPAESTALELFVRREGPAQQALSKALEGPNAAETIGQLLERARTPIRLHGRRTEEMFVYVVAALGLARLIKREDAGDVVVQGDTDIAVPDFRVILESGAEVLVEVKNCNERNPHSGRRFTREYLDRLLAYGALCGRPVYLAVYWSAWRSWTLHQVAEVRAQLLSARMRLSFLGALPHSEMRLLGDYSLATEHPLLIRFAVSGHLLETEGTTSKHAMRIEAVELKVNGRPILVKRDMEIAWGLMLYGKWVEREDVHMSGDSVSAIDFTFAPETTDPTQPFSIVSSVSSLASSQFNDMTVQNSTIRRLRPGVLPDPPYPKVTDGYLGQDLPLWRFVQAPTPWPRGDGTV